MEHDRQIFLSFWTFFCPFTLLTTQKTKTLKNWKKLLEISPFYTSVLPSRATLNSGVTLNSHTLSMETHWIVPITATSHDVCVLDCSLKVSVLQPQNFWNILTTFDLLFLPKQQFSNEKNLMFKDKALFESYFFKMCPGTCRNICLICPCHRLLLFW